MTFINVDSVEIDINEPKAEVETTFRYYYDLSSKTPGEHSAKAKLYFELDSEGDYYLTRLVIKQFGIE